MIQGRWPRSWQTQLTTNEGAHGPSQLGTVEAEEPIEP